MSKRGPTLGLLRAVLLGAPLLLAAACGTKPPPPAVSPTTSTLATAPGTSPRGRTPWAGSRFFAPKRPAPAPLLSRPRRPIRGPAVHTLRS